MGETTGTPQNPQDDEQKNSEGGADQEPKGETVTTVIETPVTEKPVEEQEEQISVTNEPVEDAVMESAADPAESEKPEISEAEEELDSNGSSLDSMEVAEDVKVSVAQVVLDDNGKPAEFVDLKDATLSFTQNTVDDDGTVNKDAKNILFKVTPASGKRVSKLEYALGTSEEDFAFDKNPNRTSITSNVTDPNAEYTVKEPISSLITKKNLVRIYVTVVDVEYKVAFDSAAVPGATIHLKKTDGSNEYNTTPQTSAAVTYGSSLTFAVKGLTEGNDKVTAKQKSADDSTAVRLTGEKLPIDGDANEAYYLEYTLAPSDIADLATTANDDITVIVAEDTKPIVSLAAKNLQILPVGAKITTGGVGAEGYKNLATTESYSAGDKIAFTATVGNENYKLTEMSAYWVASSIAEAAIKDSDKHTLEVAAESFEVPNKDNVDGYVIDLTEVTEAANLYVTINAEMDDTKDAVKTVAFAGDGHAVAVVSTDEIEDIKEDAKKNIIGKSPKTEGNEYRFKVQADEGYAVTEIKTEITKKYKNDETTDSETITIGLDGKKYDEKAELYPFNDEKSFTIPFAGTDKAEDENGTDRDWTTNDVKVTITTAVQTAAYESKVTLVSEGNYWDTELGAYTVEVKEEEGKVEKDGNWYTVKEGTEYLELTVKDAETDPVIKVAGGAVAEKVDGAGFTYRIPTVSLKETDRISVKRASKNVVVNYNDEESVEVKVKDAVNNIYVNGTEKENDEPDAVYEFNNTAKVNVDAKVLVEISLMAGQQAPITGVSYQVGEGSAQNAELKNGVYRFEAKASEDITVNVSKSTDKKLVLTVGDEEISPDDDGVYNVNYMSTIKVQVFNGETALLLFNAVVKDADNKNAATVAVINKEKDGAEIKVAEKERNEELTVTLTTLADRTPVTFKIKSDTTVDSISYGEEIKDGKLSLPVDTKVTTKVTMTAGNASYDNLGYAIVAKTAANAKTPLKTDDLDVRLNGDALTITAKPSDGKGKAEVAKIVLYDKNDSDWEILEGSEILVSTEKATVDGKSATVEPGTSTAKSLLINITSPDGVREDLVTGSLWYKIEVTAPSLTGVEKDVQDAIKKALGELPKYYRKSDIDKNGGISLQVIANEIENSKGEKIAIAGSEVKDFKVKVTLVQNLTDKSIPVDGTTKTVAGEAVEKTAGTQAPYYENTKAGKLKLTTMNKATVITGNKTKVAVAAPQFDKNASYTAVIPTFVDMKKGTERNPANMKVEYNEYNNTVEVYFTSTGSNYRTNINSDDYKDLGVKVTAVTDKTGYGISGVQKLTVVNGIEDIKATAQPNVKKENKKVTFKVAVDLNESSNNTGLNSTTNSKYAPKTKKVDYKIIGADDETPLPAGIAANVTVKNGTVTIAQGYTVDEKKEANNQFRVLVKAADYTGNVKEVPTNVITISGKSLPMGSLVIMKPGKNGGWSKATIVATASSSQMEVTKANACEYRAVVLQPNVGLDRDSYDLDDTEETIIDPAAFNFTPAKGGVWVDKSGYIHVSKLGKVNITAVDKSDKKNKKDLKAVSFVQKNTNMILELTQISDSTLDGSRHNKEFYNTNVEFSGNNTTLFGLRVVERDEKGNVDEIQLSDVKLGFKKNVKNVTPKKFADWAKYGKRFQYLIATTGNPGTLTFQRKGQQTVTYTLTNTTYASGKAPKVALADKKQKVVQSTPNTFTYELKSTVKGESYDGKYVMLSVDSTKTNPSDVRRAFGNYLDRAVSVRDGSQFDLYINARDAKAYNLNVAVGSLEEGVFTQEYADAKLAVKVAKKGAVNLTVGKNYTLDPQVASMVKVQYKSTERPEFANDEVDGNWAQNAIIGNKENDFRKYFVAKYDENMEPVIGLNDKITATDLDYIMTDAAADHRIGFISLQNSGKRVDVQVTIKFKAVKSLKAVPTSVLSGSDMTLDIQLYNGKEHVAVKDYSIVDGAGFNKPDKVENYLTNHILVMNEKNKKEEIVGGDIRLTGSNIEAGKVTLNLLVTPMNTPDIYKEKPAVPVKATVTIVKSDTKQKVAIAKGADKWQVSSADYVGPANIEVAKGETAPEQGIWTKAIPYTFKNALSVKENTPISVAADAKTAPYLILKSDAYSVANKNQTLTAVIDKAKLNASVDGRKLKWGSTVTVTATFAYGDDENPTTLVKDTAKLKITLPKDKDIKAEVTKADFEAVENDIQNMVETQYRYNWDKFNYEWIENDQKEYKKACNEDINARINDWLLDIAGSATVNVNVTNNEKEAANGFADTYTAKVTDAAGAVVYSHEFKAWTEVAAWSVAQAITSKSAENWKAVQNNKLFTLNKNTSETEYAAMIRNILAESGDITNNISLSVKTDANGYLAPRVGKEGRYNVTVTVIDKNEAPSSDDYLKTVSVPYHFAAMEAADVAKERLGDELKTADFVKKVVGDAWKAVAKLGMKTDDETFEAEVRKNIVDEANKRIANVDGMTGNDSLTADKIEDGTFTLTIDAGQVETLNYQLVLTDATPNAKDSTLTIDVTFNTKTAVEALQTVDDLKKSINAGKLTIKGEDAADETKAFEAVKAKIVDEYSKNPAFDAEKLVVEAPAAEKQKFVKPVGKINGLVNVSVKYPTIETPVVYENIVILASGDDFEGDTADKKELARVTGMIQAELNQTRLEEMVLAMHKDYATNKTATSEVKDENVKAEIAKIVGGDDGESGVLAGTEYQLAGVGAANIVVDGSKTFEKPANERTGMVIPGFAVTIKKGADGKTENVEIAGMTLKAMPEFQSYGDATTAFNSLTGTKENPRSIQIGYLELTQNDADDESKGFQDTDGLVKKVKETLNAENKITNPLHGIQAEIEVGVTGYKKGEGSDSFTYKIEKMKVTLSGVTGTDDDVERYIDVAVKTEATTPAVTAILFDKVDETEINYDENNAIKGDGSAVGTPVGITVEGNKTEVSLSVKEVMTTDAAENNNSYQEFIWSLVKNGATANDAEGIMIDENGVMTIPKEAAGDNVDRKLLLDVTATSKENGLDGEPVTATVYVELTFVPEVTGLTIDGPKVIELGTDGTNSNGAVYTAEVEGNHLTADDKKAIKWDGEGLGKNALTTVTPKAGGDNSEVTVTFASNASSLVGSQTLVAVTNISGLDNTKQGKNDQSVTIRQNLEKDAPEIALDETAGVTVGVLGSTEGTKNEVPKVTVTGNKVRIPLSVDLDDDMTREWTYKVYDSTGTTELSSGADANLKNITIEKNGSRSWLVIDEKLTELEDEVLNEDKTVKTPATQIMLKASAEAEGAAAAMTAKNLKFAIVVEKSVKGMKLYRKADVNGTDLGSGEKDTVGEGTITVEKGDGTPVKVFLQPDLEGNHIPADEVKKVTFKITNQTRNMGASRAQPGSNAAATIEIPAGKDGFVEVTATYKDGTDENAVVKTAKRLIKIVDPEKEATISLTDEDETEGKKANEITIDAAYDASAMFTQTYQVSKSEQEISAATWSVNVAKNIEDYVWMDADDGTLTVDAIPANGLPAGEYKATVRASYMDGDILYEKSLPVTITVKKVATEINVKAVTGDPTELIKSESDTVGTTNAIVLKKDTSGNLTISAELLGDRFTTGDEKKLQWQVNVGDSGLDSENLPTDTSADVAEGAATLSIPNSGLTADKPITVTFSVKEEGNLVDATDPVTTEVTITMASE